MDYETGKEFNALPADFDLETYAAAEYGKLKPVKEGDIFQLGGITAEIIETPGHTKGGVSVWYREKKLMFIGDATGFFVWLFLPESTGYAEYMKMLDKLYRIDAVGYLGGHNPQVMKREELLLFKRAAQTADFSTGEPFEAFLRSDKEARVCAVDGMTMKDMFQPGFASVVINEDWGK